jgi:hypothetical protein
LSSKLQTFYFVNVFRLIIGTGTGTYGIDGTDTWYFLARDLSQNLNQMLTAFVNKYKRPYPGSLCLLEK